jgi:transcription initiation factor TFIIA large subunit
MIHAKFLQSLPVVPQLDGIDDEYDDAVAEDYNEPEEDDHAPPSATTPAANVEPPESEGSEPPLNEDDDDDDVDEADNGDEEPATNHLVLAQFDKVTRSKNKWKCTLKDGIMHLNNRDILFVKATGEFEF